MGWLRFGLPLEEELEVEKQARLIRECEDLGQLRVLAEQAFRAWCHQVDLTQQLIGQVAEAEDALVRLGGGEEPDQQYLQWARELSGQTWSA